MNHKSQQGQQRQDKAAIESIRSAGGCYVNEPFGGYNTFIEMPTRSNLYAHCLLSY